MSGLRLIEAVKIGDYVTVEELLNSGADINQQGDEGWTPLNFAAGRGDLELVKLLVGRGADIFKTGSDMQTPNMIALAAGRIAVVKYLRDAEDAYQGEKPAPTQRRYCKAYCLNKLREYPSWNESRINWKPKNGHSADEAPFSDDKIVFVHQDLTVTESMWHDENVIFNSGDSTWREFCEAALKFKVPDDLDLTVPNTSNN